MTFLGPQSVSPRSVSTRSVSDMSDDDLVLRAQRADSTAQRALIERYRRVARSKVRRYFVVGGDGDDIEQEALIGLYKAIRDFDPSSSSFRTFAELCMSRQLASAVRAASRYKHRPLNLSVPFTIDPGRDASPVVELLAGRSEDPADVVVADERAGAVHEAIAGSLTVLELDVLRRYLDGDSYAEIGAALDRPVKAVDNALQRVKRKVEGALVGPVVTVA